MPWMNHRNETADTLHCLVMFVGVLFFGPSVPPSFHCSERKDELEGEIFEILLTFSDFLAFKEMVLDYRAVSHYSFLFW